MIPAFGGPERHHDPEESMRIGLLSTTLVTTALMLAGCSGTKLAAVWKDPEVTFEPFSTVVVLVMTGDQAMREKAEDTFVHGLPSKVMGIPSHDILPGTERPPIKDILERLRKVHADGVVVYRLAGIDKYETYVDRQAYYVPDSYYSSFSSYWGYFSPVVYEPGYQVEDRVVRVETNVFSVADEKLVWSAQSETLNPESAQVLVDEVVVSTIDRMRADKVLR
jgi:hypothetical protein